MSQQFVYPGTQYAYAAYPSPMMQGPPAMGGVPLTLPVNSQVGSFAGLPAVTTQPGFFPVQPQQKKKTRRGMRKPRAGGRGNSALPAPTSNSFSAAAPNNPGSLLGNMMWAQVKPSTPGGMRVQGREIMRSVIVSGTAIKGVFTIMNCPIGAEPPEDPNKQSAPSLPRMAKAAGLYEMYCFHTVTFTFVPTQYGISGTMAMYVDTDYADTAATTVAEMIRNTCSSLNTANASHSCTLTRAMCRSEKYYCASSGNTSRNLVYQGCFYWAVEGVGVRETIPDGTTIGYIVATYDVEFFTPC